MATNSVENVGYGASALGNLNREISEDDAYAVFSAAFEHGIRYFDTSPLYGYGLSELRLGHFLRTLPRHELVLSTKVGRTMSPAYGRDFDKGIWHRPLPAIPTIDYSYDGAMRSLEQTFLRTGSSHFDTVFIHDIDASTHGIEFVKRLDEAVNGAYRALADMKSMGYIGEVGIGVNDSDSVEAFLDRASIDCVMLAGDYTLYRQPASESLMPRLQGMANAPRLILAGIFNSGALADPQRNKSLDYEAADADALIRLELLDALARKHRVDLRSAALQFALKPDIVDQVVIGASRPEQVSSSLDSLSAKIPDAFWTEFHQL